VLSLTIVTDLVTACYRPGRLPAGVASLSLYCYSLSLQLPHQSPACWSMPTHHL